MSWIATSLWRPIVLARRIPSSSIRWMLRWRAAAEVRVIRSRHRDQIRRFPMTNNTYALVYPMLAMFLWTFLILLRNVQVRVSAVLKGQLSNDYFELFRGVRAIRSYLENRKSLEKPDGNAAALLHRDACHQKRGAAEAA